METLARLGRKPTLRAIGLMSGTSADGVDAALVEYGRRRVRVAAFETYPYPPWLRRRLFRLFRAETARVDEICRLNFVLGELFAEAAVRLARKARVPLKSIDVIGSHGQTIHHLPGKGRYARRGEPSTLQIGEPSVIAERTGITTVADFRPRDIAAGGQGAPLVARADFLLLGHPTRSRAVQNVGGIANVTFLPAGGGLEEVVAFDTGPGNMVIDRVVERATGGRRHYDAGGRMAAGGTVVAALLAALMGQRYFRRRPPKTTGREEFGREFADALFERAVRCGARPEDAVATATALTVESIADAYRRFLPARIDEVVLCGGGARNACMVDALRRRLPAATVTPVDDLGISADAKEAVSFAVLACETLRGRAGNVPAATGARRGVVLGKIVPGKAP